MGYYQLPLKRFTGSGFLCFFLLGPASSIKTRLPNTEQHDFTKRYTIFFYELNFWTNAKFSLAHSFLNQFLWRHNFFIKWKTSLTVTQGHFYVMKRLHDFKKKIFSDLITTLIYVIIGNFCPFVLKIDLT